MHVMLLCMDREDAGRLRAETRPAHLQYIRAHAAQILTCGPILGGDDETMIGSLYLLDVESRDAAERFSRDDPYAIAGLFKTVTIAAWTRVLPDNTGAQARG